LKFLTTKNKRKQKQKQRDFKMQIDWFNSLMGIYLIWLGINYGKVKDDE